MNLHEFFEREWEWYLQQDPLFASEIGDTRYIDRLPDYSLQANHDRQDHERDALEQLKRFDPGADEINYRVFEYRMKMAVASHAFPSYLLPMNQLLGIHHDLPLLAEKTTLQKSSDYDAYVSRLSQIPRAIDQTIGVMREGLKRKITPPSIPLRDVERQLHSLASGTPVEAPFYEPFRDRQSNSARDLIRQSVQPAFGKLLEFWRTEYFPNTRQTVGASALPNGEAWYEFAAKYSTTTNLSPREIHKIGLDEVQRIHSEMKAVIREAKFDGSYSEFLKFLRTDPQFFHETADELVRGYRDICKRIDPELPRLFSKLPRLPYGVKEVPHYIAPSQPTGFYEPGSLKTGRPGWFYANTYKLNTRPKWEMEVLSVHEAVPGHHLQFAIAEEIENVPEFRKRWKYTSYVEGWGLYSESLGDELGVYRDPHSKFGRLTYEMWRAVRLVIDTGIHALGWSRERAIDYFRENAGKQEHDIQVEVDRYIVWPGQALAYKIGELKIRELRRYAEANLGSRFGVRQFHSWILENGPLPLTILQDVIHQSVEKSA